MAEHILIDGVYALKEKVAEGGMATVYRAEVDLARFDYSLLYAYTQVQGDTHTQRRQKAEAFVQQLAGKAIDPATVRAILEAHGIPLPEPVVAIKVAKEGMDRDRFEAEWRNLLCLNHENVVKVYGGGEYMNRPYYAMEYLEHLVDPAEIATRFTIRQKLELLIQGAEGLGYLHDNGLVHRDVKPDNMVTCAVGQSTEQETDRPTGRPGDWPTARPYVTKVTDLGIAKNLDESLGLTMTGAVMGTPYYMSPEQIRSARTVDHRADIYSLGATLYRMATGVPPYHDKTTLFEIFQAVTVGEPPIPPSQHVPNLAPAINCIIRCSMAPNPDDRYPHMRDLAQDLTTYLQEENSALLAITQVGDMDGTQSVARKKRSIYVFESILEETKSRQEAAEAVTLAAAPTPTPSAPGPSAPATAPTRRRGTAIALTIAAVLLGLLAYTQGWLPFLRPSATTGPGTQTHNAAQPDAFRQQEAKREAELEAVLAGAREELAKASLAGLGAARLLLKQASELARHDEERAKITALGKAIDQEEQRLTTYSQALLRARTLSQEQRLASLRTAQTQAQQALNLAKSEAERMAAEKLLKTIAPDIERLTRLEYDRLFREGKDAWAKGAYTQAEVALQQALALQKTEEAKLLLDVVQVKAKQQKARDKAMAQAQALLLNKQYADAAAGFVAILALDGYSKDTMALQGLHDARQGQYRKLMDQGQTHLAHKEWDQAAAAFKQVQQIAEFSRDTKAAAGIEAARSGKVRERGEPAYRAAMAAAQKHLAAGDYAEAENAFQRALTVPGYEKEGAPVQAIATSRKQRFDDAMKRAAAHMKAGQFSDAETAFRAALAVPGFTDSQDAKTGITRSQQQAAVARKHQAVIAAQTAYTRAKTTQDLALWQTALRAAEHATQVDPQSAQAKALVQAIQQGMVGEVSFRMVLKAFTIVGHGTLRWRFGTHRVEFGYDFNDGMDRIVHTVRLPAGTYDLESEAISFRNQFGYYTGSYGKFPGVKLTVRPGGRHVFKIDNRSRITGTVEDFFWDDRKFARRTAPPVGLGNQPVPKGTLVCGLALEKEDARGSLGQSVRRALETAQRYRSRGRNAQALQTLREALATAEKSGNRFVLAQAKEGLAWFLATTTADDLRNSAQALTLAEDAERLARATESEDLWRLQDTTAAALAACGRFKEAIAKAQEAKDGAERARVRTSDRKAIEKRLQLYAQGQAYRE